MTDRKKSPACRLRRVTVGRMMSVIVGLPIVTVWLLLPTWREPCIRKALLDSRGPSFWWPTSWRQEHKVRSALLSVVSIEFVETPLGDVIKFISESTRVPILLDKAALKEHGIDRDTPVAIRVDSITLGNALTLMLEDLDATCVVKDGALRVTSSRRVDSEEGKLLELTRGNAREEQLQAALQQPMTLEFVDTPLSDVVDFLRESTRVNIVLRRKWLEEAGVGMDTPVTCKADQIPLGSALKVILDNLGLTYLVKNQVLQITSKAHAAGDDR